MEKIKNIFIPYCVLLLNVTKEKLCNLCSNILSFLFIVPCYIHDGLWMQFMILKQISHTYPNYAHLIMEKL